LISLSFWLLVKLSEEDSSAIKYPVIYKNMPDGKLMTSNSANHIYLHMNLKGFELIGEKFFKKHYPLIINLSGLEDSDQQSPFNSYILISDLEKAIENQIENSINVIKISPDTVFFSFEDIMSKKVPVVPNISYHYQPQYQLYDTIKLYPDSIRISGVESMIDTIGYVETVAMNITEINGDRSLEVAIKMTNSKDKIQYSPEIINVDLKVEKFTESVYTIPIRIISDDPNKKIRIFPDKVKVIFMVALRDFSRVDTGMFESAIVYSTGSDLEKLDVDLLSYPSFVKVTRIEPRNVEYIILK
jgi:hypothetical protein